MSTSEHAQMAGVELTIAKARWSLDTSTPIELAIRLNFDGEQARAFGMPPARSEAVEGGGFVGDRRRGGSVNCETIEVTPHGNGTHTECVGHITEERISVADVAPQPLLAATVLTVPARSLSGVDEGYGGDFDTGDRLICRQDLSRARRSLEIEDEFLQALIIRVGDDEERFDARRDHSGTNPPYLSEEAAIWLRQVGCEHLLVELPSVDRESDGGTVPNHHLFFGLEQGKRANEESRRRTITEMIAVPDFISDGRYGLSLRFPRFKSDAAPSRPIIYGLQKASTKT